MSQLSDRLKGYGGANPFYEAQAKSYSNEKIVSEFLPTSLYWSLFNEQHEILLGTRGSGKTVILRMLSYSCLSKFSHERAAQLSESRNFIGVYVPLHLEFLSSLPGEEYEDQQKTDYFQFAFNCSAVISLLREIHCLLVDLFDSPTERRRTEARIISRFVDLWFSEYESEISTLEDVEWRVRVLYEGQRFWPNGERPANVPFAKDLLTPLLAILPIISTDLGLDRDATNWLVCVDEAEFLPESFIRCFNSFIRSEKRPVVLKIATLPFYYTTRETLTQGTSIELNGNDAIVRVIDRDSDSDDFLQLTDHILDCRLKRTPLYEERISLEDFLGKAGGDDLIDYYRLEFSESATEASLIAEIVADMSEARRLRFARIKNTPARVQSDYLKRFAPIHFVRKMFKRDHEGNRTVAWFAGAKTVRRMADGNPRRFILIMSRLVDTARDFELTFKNQHRALKAYSSETFEGIEALPNHGFTLKSLLERVCDLLHNRVHSMIITDSGYFFAVSEELLSNQGFQEAVRLGIAYSWLFCDEVDLKGEIYSVSGLRVANICAVEYWLPMRRGNRVRLQSKAVADLFAKDFMTMIPQTRQESSDYVSQLMIDLEVNDADELNGQS